MLSANQLYLFHTTGEYETEKMDGVFDPRIFEIAEAKLKFSFPQSVITRMTHRNEEADVSGFHVYTNGALEAFVVFNTSTSIKPKSVFKGALYTLLAEQNEYCANAVYSLFVNNGYSLGCNELDFLSLVEMTDKVKGMRSMVVSACKKAKVSVEIKVKNEMPKDVLPKPFKKKLASFLQVFPQCDLSRIPEHLLNEKQSIVKQVHISGECYVDMDNLKAELLMACDLSKAIYILDFESTNSMMPLYKNLKPYEQLAFQYSVHKLHNEKLTHHEFIELEKEPRLALAKQLIKDVGDHGVILAYNAGFERKIIKSLAELFPLLASKLMAIADRLYDLYPLFKKYYYHPSQRGSWSLKKVLPAVLGFNPYDQLEGTGNGEDASNIYQQVRAGLVTVEQAQQELLAYCCVDTYALYQLIEFVFEQQLVA